MADRTTIIAKNTIALYVRSLVVLFIALYTSRITLQVLGVEDFGIYNVVGGIIGLLGFMNNSMQATYQRYYNVALGENDENKLINDFKVSLTIQFLLALMILIVGETIGVWWLENKMIIPESRMEAARWVYQMSIFSFLLSVMSAPYGALITAFEKMQIFAIISIIDAVLRLVVVLMLPVFLSDKLIVYALLLLLITVFDAVAYVIYCKKNISHTCFCFSWNKKLLGQMASFSGWSMFGTLAYTLKDAGVNLVLNMFFGPIVNAARGVAMQVNNAVNQFVMSFQTAFRPQLTQSYASGDREYMEKMYFSATKMSFYLIFFISFPLMLEMDYVLHLWLGDNVPEHTTVFTIITLLITFVSAFANPTSAIAFATGKIKSFSIMVGSLNILILPVVYVFLKLGYGPTSAFIVSLIFTVLVQVFRLFIVSKIADISVRAYFLKVVCPIFCASFLSMIAPIAFVVIVEESSFLRLLTTSVISVFSCTLFIWMIGLSKIEKDMLKLKISHLLHRR